MDEFDQLQVVRNTFFNLYCYNEYVKDVYETNKVKHFELILEKSGFVLSSQGVPAKLTKATRTQQSQLADEISDELFDEYLASEAKLDQKFQTINKTVEYLKLPQSNPEVLTRFKDVVMNKWAVRDHDSVIRFLKSGASSATR